MITNNNKNLFIKYNFFFIIFSQDQFEVLFLFIKNNFLNFLFIYFIISIVCLIIDIYNYFSLKKNLSKIKINYLEKYNMYYTKWLTRYYSNENDNSHKTFLIYYVTFLKNFYNFYYKIFNQKSVLLFRFIEFTINLIILLILIPYMKLYKIYFTCIKIKNKFKIIQYSIYSIIWLFILYIYDIYFILNLFLYVNILIYSLKLLNTEFLNSDPTLNYMTRHLILETIASNTHQFILIHREDKFDNTNKTFEDLNREFKEEISSYKDSLNFLKHENTFNLKLIDKINIYFHQLYIYIDIYVPNLTLKYVIISFFNRILLVSLDNLYLFIHLINSFLELKLLELYKLIYLILKSSALIIYYYILVSLILCFLNLMLNQLFLFLFFIFLTTNYSIFYGCVINNNIYCIYKSYYNIRLDLNEEYLLTYLDSEFFVLIEKFKNGKKN